MRDVTEIPLRSIAVFSQKPRKFRSFQMKRPMRVAVTGAAGQIGYSLLFRIASGEMLGKETSR